jgi:hypothetical protein
MRIRILHFNWIRIHNTAIDAGVGKIHYETCNIGQFRKTIIFKYIVLLLQELVLVVNQRHELVLQRDEEERMIENDEQIEHDVTIPDEQLVRGKTSRDECRMQ